jgi:hypothetical protein
VSDEVERAKAALITAAKAYLAATTNAAVIIPMDAHRFVVLGNLVSIRGILDAMLPSSVTKS